MYSNNLFTTLEKNHCTVYICSLNWKLTLWLAGGVSLEWQISGFMIKYHSKNLTLTSFCQHWPLWNISNFLMTSEANVSSNLVSCTAWNMWQTSPPYSATCPDTTIEMRMRRTRCPSTAWGSLLNTSILLHMMMNLWCEWVFRQKTGVLLFRNSMLHCFMTSVWWISANIAHLGN